jgi:hypothetical protein
MRIFRLLAAVTLLALLAACDNSPKRPPKPATVAEQPAAEAPAKAEVQAPTPAARPLKPASAEATAPLFGTWAVDLAECEKPEATITISVARYESNEQKCSISGLGDNGDGSYTANLACSGGKTERVAMTPLFAPTGEGIGIVWLDRGNQAATVLRCK